MFKKKRKINLLENSLKFIDKFENGTIFQLKCGDIGYKLNGQILFINGREPIFMDSYFSDGKSMEIKSCDIVKACDSREYTRNPLKSLIENNIKWDVVTLEGRVLDLLKEYENSPNQEVKEFSEKLCKLLFLDDICRRNE